MQSHKWILKLLCGVLIATEKLFLLFFKILSEKVLDDTAIIQQRADTPVVMKPENTLGEQA